MGDPRGSADEAIQRGDLNVCRSILIDEVRRNPTDRGARLFLFQLQAICGEWEKALIHLKALTQIDPSTQLLANAYGSALMGEIVRANAYAGRIPLVTHVPAGDWGKLFFDAYAAQVAGKLGEAESLRERAFALVPETPADIDGLNVPWLSDADAWVGPFLEAMVDGQWGLIPFSEIAEISIRPHESLRDFVWARAHISLRGGEAKQALLPVRYAGTEMLGDAADKLGRSTRFIDRPEGDRAVGQRLWISDGDAEFPLLDVRKVQFG
jgi:protein involved in temperature-dependent protein secretion